MAQGALGDTGPLTHKPEDIFMRKLCCYVKKYGKVEGTKMYRCLQREAALASVHARQKKRLGI